MMKRLIRFLLLGAAGLTLLSVAGVRWGGTAASPASRAGARAVMVASRQLEAGAVLAAADADVRSVPAADGLPGVVATADAVVGRRLLVSVPAGSPLLGAMLGPPLPQAGTRIVVVVIDADHLDPSIAAGAEVDVLAAVDGDNRAGAVEPVAVARVVALVLVGDGPPRAAGARGGAPSVALTLQCDAAVAVRIVWAETYARTLRVLLRDPGGGAPLTPVDGLAR